MKKKKIISLILIGVCCLSILVGSSFAVMADENKAGQEKSRTLDMAEAGQIALKNNPSIKAVKERLTQAETVVKQAKAAFYPSLDASGSVSMTGYSDASALPDIDEEYSAELSATLVLFSGFSSKLALDLAASANSSEIEAWNNAKRLLLLSVAQSYTNVQLATAAIETWETDTRYYEKLLKDAEIKHKAGSGSLSDVLSFKVQVNAAESDLTDAQKNYRIALAGFAAILGYDDLRLPEGTALTSLGSDLYNKTSLPDINALIQLAELNRPDLKQSEYAVTQAKKNIGISQSGYYPTVSLYGTYNGQRNDDAGFDSADFSSTAGVKVSFNIFSGGLTKSKVAEARTKKKKIVKTIDNPFFISTPYLYYIFIQF